VDLTERNKQHVRAAEQALASGGRDGWLAALAEHVRWTVMGRTSWSRTYEGKAAIRTELIDRLAAQYAGPYRRDTRQLIGEGEWVVARSQGDVTLRTGERYDNQYCFWYRLRDGLIEEIIEYGDTALIERVLQPWSPPS
jgi:uncharacterized protein